jgi:hypothetical protein
MANDDESAFKDGNKTAKWRLRFWIRADHSLEDASRIELWCNSQREARHRFGEYRRTVESHTLTITEAELLSPSGRTAAL